MKTRAIKLISLMLALLMCVAVFAACKKDGETAESSEDSASSTVETVIGEDGERYDANGYLMDDLPEKADFGGLQMTVYMWEEQKAWEFVDTTTYPTALVDQALYKREINIEERFNIKIDYFTQKGSWDFRDSFIQTLSNSVLVNDQAYDLVGQYTATTGHGVSQGLYLDLNTLENINTEKPWWPKHISSSSTLNGKLFALTGDISPTLIRNVQCMYVNTDLYESYNVAQRDKSNRSIYEIVRNYDWTLENMKVLALGYINNEGIEESEKMYGLSILNSTAPDGFLYSGGFKMVEDKDGKIQISEDVGTLKFSNWFDDVHELFQEKHQDIYYIGAATSGAGVFQTNRAIFYTGNVSDSQNFAQRGVQFSILPMPMRDKDQGAYYTMGSFWVTMWTAPIDVKDKAMSGLLLEALGSEAYRTVTDEIYYNLFQTRYNSGGNEDSAEMFDIVSDSVVFDASRIFQKDMGCFGAFRTAIQDPESSWTSVYDSNYKTWKGNLTSLIAKIG